MYQVFLGEVPLPIAPSSITTTINNRNETVDLIDGSQINILKKAGLTEISFSFLIPSQNYPFATPSVCLSQYVFPCPKPAWTFPFVTPSAISDNDDLTI